jgi:hypothetical protein
MPTESIGPIKELIEGSMIPVYAGRVGVSALLASGPNKPYNPGLGG